MNTPSEYIILLMSIITTIIGFFLTRVINKVDSHDNLLGSHNNEIIKAMAEIKALENSTRIEHNHFAELANSKFETLDKNLGDLNISIKELNKSIQLLREDNATLKAKFQKQ